MFRTVLSIGMYVPAAFRETDVTTMVALARSAGFGHLTVIAEGAELISSPIPFVISDDGTEVRAHVARPNTIWRVAPCRALLIVPVSDTYISPAWYPSKAEHGKVVPTWNYEVVHAHGSLVAHDDPAWVRQQIGDLTDANEQAFDAPWSIDDPPAGYIDQMMRGIVGVELRVDRLEGKRKLSQNRVDDDLAGAIAGLIDTDRRGAAAVRAAMIEAEAAEEAR